MKGYRECEMVGTRALHSVDKIIKVSDHIAIKISRPKIGVDDVSVLIYNHTKNVQQDGMADIAKRGALQSWQYADVEHGGTSDFGEVNVRRIRHSSFLHSFGCMVEGRANVMALGVSKSSSKFDCHYILSTKSDTSSPASRRGR